MTIFRVTPQAMEDLRSIARYTEKTWGRERRVEYLEALDKRFQWLANYPQSGKERLDIHAGYRSFPEGQHIVFYRLQNNSVEILGVVHKHMDIDAAFDQ